MGKVELRKTVEKKLKENVEGEGGEGGEEGKSPPGE